MLLSTWHGVNFGLGLRSQGDGPRPFLLIETALKSIPNEPFSFCQIDYRPLNTKKQSSLLAGHFKKKMHSSSAFVSSVFVWVSDFAGITKLFVSIEEE